MFQVLVAAAAIAAGVWALLRLKRRITHACKPRIDTTIEIGGPPDDPKITKEPEPLCASAKKPDTLNWDVFNSTRASQRIDLRGFRKDNKPSGQRAANDTGDIVPAGGRVTLRARVLGNAKKGNYKYDIELNGKPAVDPDVVIWEEGGG